MKRWNENQSPDTRPGYYYVSVRRGDGDTRLLSGPYPNDHQSALDDVRKAKDVALDLDPKASWYDFGTCRCDDDLGPGILNRHGLMSAGS